jgi:plasmid stabilization system protein ParE
MRYRVLIQPPAGMDLDEAYRWIACESPGRATSWFNGVLRAIQSLSRFPRRCPVTPENDAFSEDIRQLICGSYRVLFVVDGDQVRVLHLRHGARRHLTTDQALSEES